MLNMLINFVSLVSLSNEYPKDSGAALYYLYKIIYFNRKCFAIVEDSNMWSILNLKTSLRVTVVENDAV